MTPKSTPTKPEIEKDIADTYAEILALRKTIAPLQTAIEEREAFIVKARGILAKWRNE